MTPPLAHRLGTRLIRLGVLLHGVGTLLLVRRTRPARGTMTHGGVRHARVVMPCDTGRMGGAEFRRPNGMWEHGTEVRAHNAGEAAEILWLVDLQPTKGATR